MKRSMTAVSVALVLAGVGAAAQESAPFGIPMGAQKASLKIASELPGSLARLASVPRPHPDMEEYIVEVTPSTGVCWVKAVGKNVSTSVYGEGAQNLFTDLKSQLDGVYGPAKVTDRAKPGSIWDEPKDWMMGLLKKERTLIAIWGSTEGRPLTSNVQYVGLVITALSRDTVFASVEYYGTTYEKCELEAKTLKANAFK